jgi:superfamily I DNA/RNA helicase
MTKFEIDDRDLWFRCEIATGLWLEKLHGPSSVEWVNDRPIPPVRPTDRIEKRDGAPRVTVGDREVRSPDFKVTLESGQIVYWEVKQRASAWRDETEGTSYFWVARKVFADYFTLASASSTACTVQILVYEGNYLSGRWYRADLRDLQRIVRIREFNLVDDDGKPETVSAVLWPVHSMLEMSVNSRPSLTEASQFIGDPGEASVTKQTVKLGRIGEPGDLDAQTALELLRREIGLESFPRYSVLYAHRSDTGTEQLHKVLSLTDFGLRVFLITDDKDWAKSYPGDPDRREALLKSWILEVSVVESIEPKLNGPLEIDGIPTWNGSLSECKDLWVEAERVGAINTRQYEIVHSRSRSSEGEPEETIVVTASAGTGKTETLTERIIFLLCTSSVTELHPSVDQNPPFDLRLDEIVLITFTREAAREMRERITRSLVLRRRLCTRCAMPILAWLSQLGSTNISTIHAFAKKLIQTLGPREGVAADFAVGTDYERFEDILRDVVNAAYLKHSEEERRSFPEIHEVHQFVHDIWDSLVRNGTNVLNLRSGPPQVAALDWSAHLCTQDWAKGFGSKLPEIVDEIARRYRIVCRERKIVPIDQLLSIAGDLVCPRHGENDELMIPRYLFIDEFQDTDEQQIDLALFLRDRGTRLFVVGDSMQAIYRFRGAAGNAFELLRKKLVNSRRPYQLTRNFRTDGNLLQSMQSQFDSWAGYGHLALSDGARLQPSHERSGSGSEISLLATNGNLEERRLQAMQLMTDEVRRCLAQSWANEEGGEPKIAVLCRTNRQALQVKEFLSPPKVNINCEIAKGGDFYRTRAVAELRGLLRSLANPSDTAALLELLETAWGHAIYHYYETHDSLDGRGLRRYFADKVITELWTQPLKPGAIVSWGSRLVAGRFQKIDRSDLDPFGRRVTSLAGLLRSLPLIEMISEIDLVLKPHDWLHAIGDADPAGYERCLDHALLLLDEVFGNSSLSVREALDWLNLKANTDRDEEEPESGGKPDVLAITVHKAKGREFESVIIPFCDSNFTSDKRTNITMISADGKRRVGWRWWHGRGSSGYLIDANTDASFEAHDDLETIKEETRLLYVAMTRAKKRLTIIARQGGDCSSPECWADLLEWPQDRSPQ